MNVSVITDALTWSFQSGFNYTFLCNGDIDCYYDAKALPTEGDDMPLWQYRWGSGQWGITPGHVQLLLWWTKVNSTNA
jgi:hypothetical protein